MSAGFGFMPSTGGWVAVFDQVVDGMLDVVGPVSLDDIRPLTSYELNLVRDSSLLANMLLADHVRRRRCQAHHVVLSTKFQCKFKNVVHVVHMDRDGNSFDWRPLVVEATVEQPVDGVTEAVRADLLDRSRVGIKKYGVTLDRDDLSLAQWLQHAYEECLDQAQYLKRSIIELEKRGSFLERARALVDEETARVERGGHTPLDAPGRDAHGGLRGGQGTE